MLVFNKYVLVYIIIIIINRYHISRYHYLSGGAGRPGPGQGGAATPEHIS